MDEFDESIEHDDQEQISALLMGRKVVRVEEAEAPNEWGDNRPAGLLHLDNGKTLILHANDGCGGCSAGWYEVKSLNECDNVITKVEVEHRQTNPDDEYGDSEVTYTLFVWAEDKRLPLAVVEGDDGNGYYGTGFSIRVSEDNNQ